MRDDRFQNQHWLVRLWRLRHYLMIPWMAFYAWRRGEPWDHAWHISVGWTQVIRMNWVYTLDEVKKRCGDQ